LSKISLVIVRQSEIRRAYLSFQDVRQAEVCETVRRSRACLLMVPMTMTEIIAATIPKTINQPLCGLSNVSSESAAPIPDDCAPTFGSIFLPHYFCVPSF
jgi:hypothetical protein